MTTKAQEREALKQIKKILETLEGNSYIKTAFDGVIEDAEENIENDFALSWKDRANSACEKYAEQAETLKEAERQVKDCRDHIKYQEEQFKAVSENLNSTINKLNEITSKYNRQSETVERQESEIIKLKAKLYDLMTAE